MECGTRSPLIGSALAGDLGALLASKQAPAKPDAAAQSTAVEPVAEPPRAGSAVAALAGVGVLLLSMGVGVLIGRSSAPTAKAAAIPAQVISVSSTGASAGTTTGASQAPAPSTTTPNSTKPSPKHGSKKASSSESSSGGVGQVPSKPAPPTVLEHLRGGKGQSYEQKSKSLPNVVSTG